MGCDFSGKSVTGCFARRSGRTIELCPAQTRLGSYFATITLNRFSIVAAAIVFQKLDIKAVLARGCEGGFDGRGVDSSPGCPDHAYIFDIVIVHVPENREDFVTHGLRELGAAVSDADGTGGKLRDDCLLWLSVCRRKSQCVFR